MRSTCDTRSGSAWTLGRSSGSEAVSGGGEMSEEELRAVWLRRVENDPAEFLRARFAYQLYRDGQETADE